MTVLIEKSSFFRFLICLLCSIELLVYFLVSKFTDCYFFDEYILFFIALLVIAAIFNLVQFFRIKKGYKKERKVNSNPHFVIVFTFFYLVIFSGVFILFPNDKDYEKFVIPFLIKFFMLFYILPLFLKDIRLEKTKNAQCLINFLPFTFLLPFYLGEWANDTVIVKLFYVCIAYLLSFNLNLKFFYKLTVFISFSVFILVFSINQVIMPLCILISVILILQFKRKSTNCFILSIISSIAIIKIVTTLLPAFFNIFNEFSIFFSKTSSMHIAGGSALGLSLSGYGLFFALFLVTVLFVYLTKNIRYIYPLFIFIFVYSLYLQVFPILLDYYPPIALNIRFILPFVLCILLYFNEEYFILIEKHEESKRKELKPKWIILFSSAIFIFLLFVFFKPIFTVNQNTQKRIAIVSTSKEIADLSPVSNTDSVGFAYSPYIYGSIQMYLELFGYKTKVFYGLENVPLTDFDGLLLIHYNSVTDDTLKEKIKNFTAKGGSVFAVSDHTNIFNSMKETNALLNFSSLKINDDISDSIMHYSGKVWQNSLDYFYSFITCHIKNENDIGVWGGASVSSTNIFAEPFIIAKYGLSDPGDHSEEGKANSFMRNRKFNIGEYASDIPLVFKTSFGKGNVVVFGDASYFQLPILMYNWKFIAKIFYENLYSENNFFKFVLNILQVIIIFLITCFIVFVNKKYNAEPFNKTILLSLILSVCIIFIFNDFNYSKNEKDMFLRFSSNFFAIDKAHKNFYSTNILAKNEISGIGYNAMKLQIPVICTNNNYLLNLSQAIVIINPRTKIANTEISFLNEYMGKGKSILLFCGKEFEKYIKDFLKNHEISFSDDFLGPLPWKNINIPETQNIDGPEFKEAWNILYNKDNTIPYYSYNDMVPITKTKIKNGSLYFIADSRFVSPDNLEGEMKGNKQNIGFIQGIFKNIYKKADK